MNKPAVVERGSVRRTMTGTATTRGARARAVQFEVRTKGDRAYFVLRSRAGQVLMQGTTVMPNRRRSRNEDENMVMAVAGANSLDAIELVKHGLPACAISALAATVGLPKDRVLELIGLARSTIGRKESNEAILSSEESEKVAGAMKVIGRALELMEGDRRLLHRWLDSPIPALGGRRPAEFMDTAEGRQLLLRNLAQVEAGAYA